MTIVMNGVLNPEKIKGIASYVDEIRIRIEPGFEFVAKKAEEIRKILAKLVEDFINPIKELAKTVQLKIEERRHLNNLFDLPEKCETFVSQPNRANYYNLNIIINQVVNGLAWFIDRYTVSSV